MLKFVAYEYPKSSDGKYTTEQDVPSMLQTRRNQLGLSQQEVAERAKIPLRQLQRIEAGTSNFCSNPADMCLRLCAALLLDPFELICHNPWQPDISSLSEQYVFDSNTPEDALRRPKKTGRKPIRRDVMTVYFNHPQFGIIIPRFVLEVLGSPDYIQMLWNHGEKRFLFHAVNVNAEHPYDVPRLLYQRCTALVFPPLQMTKQIQDELGWDNETYAVECRLVSDKQKEKYIFCDLNTAQPSEHPSGPYAMPSEFDDDFD